MFLPDERIAMVRREIATMGLENVEVVGFNALLMAFAEKQGASMILRGLRAVADFEYEYQMAGMNQQINANIETVFLMADVSLQPIASKLVKEIALFGGEISRFVSPAVKADVEARVARDGRLGDD
jgi:pantetheine-phosphate adenylyltransferase